MKYRARSTLLAWNSGVTRLIPSLTSASTLNRPAASGAVPYVVSRLSWFARSSLSLGTRLGMDAAVAGFQNWLATPARNLATHRSRSEFGEQGDGEEQAGRGPRRRRSSPSGGPAGPPPPRPAARTAARAAAWTSHTPTTAQPLAARPPCAQRGRQHGQRDDAQPVAEAGQGQRDPQPAERLDGKNARLAGMIAPGGAVPELPPAGAVLTWCGAEVHGVRVSALLAA